MAPRGRSGAHPTRSARTCSRPRADRRTACAILRRRRPPAGPQIDITGAAARRPRQGPNHRERARRDRRRPDPHRPAGARLGRHGQGVGQGRRGRQGASPGLRGHGDAAQAAAGSPARSPSARSQAASAWSGRSWSTARGSRRSRSSATAASAAPSCTSCASASARPRPFGSAERGASPATPDPSPAPRRRDGPRQSPAATPGTLSTHGRASPQPPVRARSTGVTARCASSASTRSASPQPAARSSRRP